MSRPSRNDLDHARLLLTPREYLRDPYDFGRLGPASWFLPRDGTAIGLRVARRQHDLARHWVTTRRPKTGEIRREYGISKQTWSRIILGERWAGQIGLEVLLAAWEDTSG